MDLDLKKDIFRQLVEAEDAGEPTDAARRRLAEQYSLEDREIRSIEAIGIEENWPPLEPCDDDEV